MGQCRAASNVQRQFVTSLGGSVFAFFFIFLIVYTQNYEFIRVTKITRGLCAKVEADFNAGNAAH